MSSAPSVPHSLSGVPLTRLGGGGQVFGVPLRVPSEGPVGTKSTGGTVARACAKRGGSQRAHAAPAFVRRRLGPAVTRPRGSMGAGGRVYNKSIALSAIASGGLEG